MAGRLVLLCLLSSAVAAGEYEELIDDARRILVAPEEALTMEQRLNSQYEKLAEAALRYPNRWEAYWERGLNRCKRAFFAHGEAEQFLARARARGADDAAIARTQRGADEQIGRWIAEAHHNFRSMEAAMRRRGERYPDHILFANAAMKFAGREYEQARQGQSGAIDDFKELVRRGFLPELCADHIALCYLDLGYNAYRGEEYEVAQGHWDEALRWARQSGLRQIILTNKAGGYEMDNEYRPAEEILRRQIREEPHRPAHHKNLGLVLGYQNRLKEALYHYGKARELCQRSGQPAVALLHGNAWIRAAVIHGKLLEHDGDVRLAWRLFYEYRLMFGDDYNFSLWFGDFASTHGEYDLAWRYLTHARDLQPHCTVAYQMLTQIAPRTAGTREEVMARVEDAKKAFLDAQARYVLQDETPAVKRICGGLGDIGDVGSPQPRMSFLDPDPLAGHDLENPPRWVEEAAGMRDPFVPWEPPAGEEGEGPQGPLVRDTAEASWLLYGAVGAGILLLGGAILVLRRRRAG